MVKASALCRQVVTFPASLTSPALVGSAVNKLLQADIQVP